MKVDMRYSIVRIEGYRPWFLMKQVSGGLGFATF